MKTGIFNHHPFPVLKDLDLKPYQRVMVRLAHLVLSEEPGPDATLRLLKEVEISLVDDESIARIHEDYMNIPGATDVITFPHGEIIVSLDTARRHAEEYGEIFEKEVLRYIVHGFLHLHGYVDYTPQDREHMHAIQEKILGKLI